MRILAIADRPPSRSIHQIISMSTVDLIITLGDLDQHALAELSDIVTIPKIGVYGNHCSGLYMESLGIRNMHLATFSYNGLMFGGFEGSVRYKESAYAKMYTQEEASRLLKDFPHVDVLVTHCPPYGINDEPGELSHEGFIGLRAYLEREQPAYLFHGHTYPKANELVTQYGGTHIEYVFGEKIIDIATNEIARH